MEGDQMTTRPITLIPDQVRAALAGRLTQVRMPCTPNGSLPDGKYEMKQDPVYSKWLFGPANASLVLFMQAAHGWVDKAIGKCPWGVVGDRLFCWYPDEAKDGKWCNCLDFDITGIRVERLGDIWDDDCIACLGALDYLEHEGKETIMTVTTCDPRRDFVAEWDAQYGHRHPWASNPWTWVLDVRKVGE